MRIGVDVGGTNTDAVIMDGASVVCACKRPTTADVSTGIEQAVSRLLTDTAIPADAVTQVMIGTTHFTNALVECRRLLRVGIIRLGLPATASLPPLCGWPGDIAGVIGAGHCLVEGGYEYDGREICRLNEAKIAQAARDFHSDGLAAVAISCVFSTINDAMEKRAAEIVREQMPDAFISCSADIGSIGLLERENAAILNSSLSTLAREVVESFGQALVDLKINAPFFISQNDGTLMTTDYARRFPVLTIASGPTNSMRGAAFLSGQRDAIVVDIGGTTTDVGVLTSGFPRESSVSVDIGGVRTNFRMPDILSIGLGGGSVVRQDPVRVGPDSVGFRLDQEARVFGGDTLTATDVVVAAGVASIGDRGAVAGLDRAFVGKAGDLIHQKIEEAVDRVKTSAAPQPVVLVGGGSILVARPIAGSSSLSVPEHADVANAIGAAIAQIGGEVDRIFSYQVQGREAALAEAKAEATQRAINAGAQADSVEIVNVEELPLNYVPGGAVRVKVKAIGDLQIA